MSRNFAKGRHGERANAILTVVGHNRHLVLRWLRAFLRQNLAALLKALAAQSALTQAF